VTSSNSIQRATRSSLLIVLAISLTMPVAAAAEAVWPKDSAGDLSIFVTMQRFRIYADHCSARLPQLKPEFKSLMEDLHSRAQRIAKGLLASGPFMGMRDKPVPPEIIAAFKDSFEDMQHNFERRDAASICPKTLQDLRGMDDSSLKSALTEVLTAVQKMIGNLEETTARAKSPRAREPSAPAP
jgi:hypothetical protein